MTTLIAVTAIALGAAMLAGCAASDGPVPGADNTPPPPVELPRLTGLEPAVQDQVRARHAAVLALEGDAGASGAALADAHGELGLGAAGGGLLRGRRGMRT